MFQFLSGLALTESDSEEVRLHGQYMIMNMYWFFFIYCSKYPPSPWFLCVLLLEMAFVISKVNNNIYSIEILVNEASVLFPVLFQF